MLPQRKTRAKYAGTDDNVFLRAPIAVERDFIIIIIIVVITIVAELQNGGEENQLRSDRRRR